MPGNGELILTELEKLCAVHDIGVTGGHPALLCLLGLAMLLW